MMERSADAYEHNQFKDVIVRVANVEIYYKALTFYLQEQPLLLTDLLVVLTPRIDHTRVVRMFRKKDNDNLPLIKNYLVAIQHLDVADVNDAYNELLIEEEQVPTLRDSILNFSNFDSMALARRLEEHELLEFRRLAVLLYNKNKKWEESISLSKRDKLFQDAILTAAESNEEEVAEEVLTYFVDIGSKECFAATLFLCFNLLRPDIVQELSWINGLNDYAFPYQLQVARDQSLNLTKLRAEIEELKAARPKAPVEDGRKFLIPGPASDSFEVPKLTLFVSVSFSQRSLALASTKRS